MNLSIHWLARGGIIGAILVALLFTGALATAQVPAERLDFGCPMPTSSAEPLRAGETETWLNPGLNLVGWVGDTVPVSKIFTEIAVVDTIWAWDSRLGEWVGAFRDMPPRLTGHLTHVAPGMGLQMQICGGLSVSWRRSAEPVSGVVRLRTGWNLVAWSGPSGTPIEDAVKGIGWSLRSVRRWDSAQQRWFTWTSPERSAQIIPADASDRDPSAGAAVLRRGVQRGEALWINVSRAVNWLQPTGVLPRLVFAGGASPDLQARVRADLQDTLSFFRDQYGIQADPDFTIYVAKDVDALLQSFRDDGQSVDDAFAASRHALWNRTSGWAGGRIVVKQKAWPLGLADHEFASGRYTLTHEYFHILQRQLSNGGDWPSIWLVEGTASWADEEHAVIDGLRTGEDVRLGKRSSIRSNTPTLRSTERGNDTWQYDLGWLAIDQLSEIAGLGSYVEFWRRLTPTETGPHGRWTSELDWRSAFQDVFGVTVSKFYSDYFQPLRLAILTTRTWEEEQAAAAAKRTYEGFPSVEAVIPRDSASSSGPRIHGRIMNENGTPAAGILVNAVRVEGETDVDWNRRTETADDGTFAVSTPVDGDYRLSLDVDDDCTRYYNKGELVDSRHQAGAVQVVGHDVREVNIQLTPGTCGWRIYGRVVGDGGEPLAGIAGRTCWRTDTRNSMACTAAGWRTALDGSFAVRAEHAGEYQLSINPSWNSCTAVYYSASGSTADADRASWITVANTDTTGIIFRLSRQLCSVRVLGQIIRADDHPGTVRGAALCPHGGGSCVDDRTIGRDGRFAITVPVSGEYHLQFNLEECLVYFRAGRFTTTYAPTAESAINVNGRDVRLNLPLLPAGICANR